MYVPPTQLQQLALLPMQGPFNLFNQMRLIGGTPGSTAWTSSNRALYIPFALPVPTLVRRLWVAIGATGGTNSVDLGIYSDTGTRLVSHGGTTAGTANQVQFLDVTDTIIGPGAFYMACAMNGTTATTIRITASNEWPKAFGILMQASAYPLPATATFATVASMNVIPIIGFATTATP